MSYPKCSEWNSSWYQSLNSFHAAWWNAWILHYWYSSYYWQWNLADQLNPKFLATLTPSGLPPAKLELKIGAPIILLRNLNPRQGLCNGTRLVITRYTRFCIEAQILGGSYHRQTRLIPRITLHSTGGEYPWIHARKQFPIRFCFAMTINKSQGQSLDTVGVDLRSPVFVHGQLYVALSRVTNVESLSVLLPAKREGKTENIVYPEVLLQDPNHPVPRYTL